MNTQCRWKAWSIALCLLVTIWIKPSHGVYNIGTIECTSTLKQLDVQNTKEVTVECPESCLDGYCKVIGSGPYTASSSVCCAAIHNGTLVSSEGGQIILVISHSLVPYFIGSTRNGVKSRHEFQQSTVTFITKKIPHESSSTTRKTTTLSTEITTTTSVSSAAIRFPASIALEPPHSPTEGTIECTSTLEQLDVQNTKEVTVECPESCLDGYCKVIGSGPYTASSSVCCAAIHNGTLVSSEGGQIILVISHSLVPHFIGSTRNGVKSRHEFQQSTVTFISKKIPHESSNTTLKTTTLSTEITTTTSVSSAAIRFPASIALEPPYSSTEVNYAALHEDNKVDKEEFLHNKEENEVSKYEETTKDPMTTASFQGVISRTTGVISHTETKAQLTTATTSKVPEVERFLGLPYHYLIIGILLAFIGGGVFVGLVCTCLRRRVKRNRKNRPRNCTSGSKKKDSRAIHEEGDICVCYQNLNSSKQGLLLYDPETCDRPCPIRQPYEGNALISDVSMTKSFTREGLVNHEGRLSNFIQRESKCEIRYEGECSSACSSACNPEKFDF